MFIYLTKGHLIGSSVDKNTRLVTQDNGDTIPAISSSTLLYIIMYINNRYNERTCKSFGSHEMYLNAILFFFIYKPFGKY